jgi:hypothetical protein
MKLVKMWEYFISIDVDGGAYKSITILSDQSPLTGWVGIFQILNERNFFSDMKRITASNCYEKELLVKE